MNSYMAALLTLHGSDVVVTSNTLIIVISDLNSYYLMFGMENSLQFWHEGTFYYSVWEYFCNTVEK
jgi:hypothetical protein